MADFMIALMWIVTALNAFVIFYGKSRLKVNSVRLNFALNMHDTMVQISNYELSLPGIDNITNLSDMVIFTNKMYTKNSLKEDLNILYEFRLYSLRYTTKKETTDIYNELTKRATEFETLLSKRYIFYNLRKNLIERECRKRYFKNLKTQLC